MRRLLFPLLTVAMSVLPGVAAEGTLTQTTTPVSRHYLDPLTNLVHYYDADAGTLTPDPAATVGTTVYAAVDVYRRGTLPEAWTGTTGACDADFCVSWLLAYVGNHPASLRVRDWPTNAACGNVDTTEYRPATLGLVTYWKGTWEFNHCSPALACAHLLTDNVVRWSDCITY